MIVDTARERAAFADAVDVCVIGAGPAGITLARALAAGGASVALMEAGGLEISAESQDAYVGETVGLDYFPLDTCRLRYFGGTSGHWGGMCRNLDAYDFEPRPGHAWSGWPIGKADLDPYRAAVADILELSYPVKQRWGDPTRLPNPDPGFDDPRGFDYPDIPLTQAADRFRRISFRYSPPVRFGEKYRAEIAASGRIRLGLNANLVDLRLSEDGAAVTGAVFRSYDPADPGFTVRARFHALCAGGIENARLLLAASSQEPRGIGNRHDLVGRFFNEHPTFTVGDVLYEATVPPGVEFYAPTPGFMAEAGVLNAGLRLYADEPPPPLGPGKAAARSLACSADFLAALAERVLGRPPGCERDGLGAWLARGGAPAPQVGRVEIASEQALDRDCRVRLGEARDALGMPRVVLEWRLGALDVRTIRAATEALAMHLAEQGIARVRIRDWLLADPPAFPGVADDMVGGPHHLGTTRMADDPRTGVVDRDCRVHGVANLYVGGGGVFATGGHVNPTYTIVQLALRLGDHLTGRLRA